MVFSGVLAGLISIVTSLGKGEAESSNLSGSTTFDLTRWSRSDGAALAPGRFAPGCFSVNATFTGGSSLHSGA